MATDPVSQSLLANGPLTRTDAPYGLVEVGGPDAGDFLQRLCSQDVLALGDGELAPAAFLDAKGKLLVTCLAFRLGDSFWLELQEPQRPALLALLERYHFAERLSFGAIAAGGCTEKVRLAAGGERGRATRDAGQLAVVVPRRGLVFEREYGGPAALPGARALSGEAAECLRMAAGFVRVGVETEPTTLALEADLDDHCSTTKGCYTGQEIVARIHTYGHTNRKLCFLRLAAGPAINAAVPLHEPEDGVAVGRVMHAIAVPGQEQRCGLGYLPPDFQAPGTALRLADGGAVAVLW